ncbi:ABC transporter permease [Euzebya pacifica]|uniref:ABC transporter permease n=1 Tax=Euzebya pacifica TaxID=1608957 RepID=UPI0030F80F99
MTSLDSGVGWLTRHTPPFLRGAVAARIGRVALTLFPFVCLLAVWQWVALSGAVTPTFLPSVTRTFAAFQTLLDNGELLENIVISIRRIVTALLISSVLGVSLGLLMGWNKTVAGFVEPVVTFMSSLSGIAWIPIAVVWFGLGFRTVTFVLCNAMFFLIVFNTLTGVRSIPPVYRRAVATMGGGAMHVLRDVLLPGALPNIMLGIRLAIGFGWRALVAVELIGASSGIGYMIFDAAANLRSDIVLCGIIIIGMVWMATNHLVLLPIERWTVERWGLIESTRKK